MNRKQHRVMKVQKKQHPPLHIHGKPYTPEEANALAIEAWKLGKFQIAIDIYNLILAELPERADILNNLGIIFQETQKFNEALASYDKALALQHNNAGIYNNRGNTLYALKRYDEALASYSTAIALKPDYANAHNSMGNTLQEINRYEEALAHYDKAVQLRPDFAEAHNNRGATLQKMKRYEEALAEFGMALTIRQDYAEAYNNQSIALQSLRKYDEALASCDKAIALKPNYASAFHNRGLVLVSKGKTEEAEKMYLKTLELKPESVEARFGLTNIRKYRDTNHPDIRHIQMLLNKPLLPDDRGLLYFALGKIHDDCSLYDMAFECYTKANTICNSSVSYNPEKVTEITDGILKFFSKSFLAQPFPFASCSQSPVFIVGMPRSGTTLLASVLSNHHSIGSTGELPDIIDMTEKLQKLTGKGVSYPEAVQYITPEIARHLTAEYEQRLRRDTGPDIPYIVDKHPLNFRHLGLIATLLPKAHIIHCTRHPLDTGISNYFQRFSLDYDYAFDLRNIGHFYNNYGHMMAHWHNALPMPIIEVSYEDLIRNTEQTARRVLDLLGLDWDERCLAPHTNLYAVETASNWQVRQPIYQQSIERWRHYEKHLTPLQEALASGS